MAKQFKGVINLDVRDSVPDWGPYLAEEAPDGSPNVLIVLYDDSGRVAWSPYGGRIEMPTMQRLADDALTYRQWHTTALCSPARSCFLTGRNHHQNGFAQIAEGARGFPGHTGRGLTSGSVNEQRFFNAWPNNVADNLAMIDQLGSPSTYNHYPTGWATAFSTPFRMFKRYTYQGGLCDPLVISVAGGHAGARTRCATSTTTRRTSCRRSSECCGVEVPRRRAGLRADSSAPACRCATASTTRTRPREGGPVLRDVRRRGIGPTGGRRSPSAGRERHRRFEDDRWQLYHADEDRSDRTTSPTGSPRRFESSSQAVVGRGREVRRAAPRRPQHLGARGRPARGDDPAGQHLQVLPGHARRPRSSRRRTPAGARTDPRPGGDRRPRAPRGCSSRRAPGWAAIRSS